MTPPVAAPLPAIQSTPSQVAVDLSPVRQQLEQILANARCALLNGAAQNGGGITVSGLAGGSAADQVRQAIATIETHGSANWNVTAVDPVFCAALDLLHAIPSAAEGGFPGLRLTLPGDSASLEEGKEIQPKVVMPGFPGELRVDYLSHDGSVLHLFPIAAEPEHNITARPSQAFAAGDILEVGLDGKGTPQWEVAPPFGMDMIIALASSVPLLRTPRPGNVEDSATAYLRDVREGVDAALHNGARVTGLVLPVTTAAKSK